VGNKKCFDTVDARYKLDAVDTVDTVDARYKHDTVDTVDARYKHDTVYTVDTVDARYKHEDFLLLFIIVLILGFSQSRRTQVEGV
jgi:hypothetical protein